MNLILDLSQHLVAWSASLFLLSGLFLLSCSLRQKRRWNSDLAGYQPNAMFDALKAGAGRPAVSMFSVLPLPLLRFDNDEMQVVEGEPFE
jgi:hypothetical protein